MTDEITPARMRDLAERQQAFADRMDTWASDSDMADETAATLRAAADRLESRHRVEDATYSAIVGELRATLAAREALLERAAQEAMYAGNAMSAHADAGALSNAARRQLADDGIRMRALAAEIAAALKETDQ